MSEVGGKNFMRYNFMRYIYRGEEGEVIPRGATHIIVNESVTVIRARTFFNHRNIVEVICHEDVEKIEAFAISGCPRLKRVIMPGVTIVEGSAFAVCEALTDVECGQLEIIGNGAFWYCTCLRSINLSSARIVKGCAFDGCKALTDATFGNKLERVETGAFLNCTSLERITVPLKVGLIPHDNTFQGCEKLKHVGLVEGARLNETIAALHLEEWRNDMNEEIDSINQTLPTVAAGNTSPTWDLGEKAVAIRTWIESVLRQLGRYEEKHRLLCATLKLILDLNTATSSNDYPADSNPSSDEDDESSDDDSSSSSSDEEDDSTSAGYSSASDSQIDLATDDVCNSHQDPSTHSGADDDSSQD